MNRGLRFVAVMGVVTLTAFVSVVGCKEKKEILAGKQSRKDEPGQQLKEVSVGPETVKLETSMGDIVIELNEEAAPITVRNFLQYVQDGFFDGTIFHRVIPNFMIQGGGLTASMERKATHPPIVNEAANGLKNDRGTVAMARTNDPDSATSQFFINHRDNGSLNYAGPSKPGYAVFGRVVEGMDVVDEIAAVRTTRVGPHANVPVEAVVIKSAKLVPSGE